MFIFFSNHGYNDILITYSLQAKNIFFRMSAMSFLSFCKRKKNFKGLRKRVKFKQ